MVRLLVIYGRKEPVSLAKLDDLALELAVLELRMHLTVGDAVCCVCANRAHRN
jgi:hypothetical protein